MIYWLYYIYCFSWIWLHLIDLVEQKLPTWFSIWLNWWATSFNYIKIFALLSIIKYGWNYVSPTKNRSDLVKMPHQSWQDSIVTTTNSLFSTSTFLASYRSNAEKPLSDSIFFSSMSCLFRHLENYFTKLWLDISDFILVTNLKVRLFPQLNLCIYI